MGVTVDRHDLAMSKDEAAARVAQRQHGLLTRQQARQTGLSEREIDHRLSVGRWVALRRGVFAINGTPSSWEQAVLAVCLTAVGAAASHLTAAALWGLPLPAPERIDVTTAPTTRLRLDGVAHHRRSALPAAELTRCRGIPITTPARTLVDTSGSVAAGRLGPIVDDGLRRRLLSLVDLRSAYEGVDTGSGRRSTRAMRLVLAERAPGYDPGGSDRERAVLRALASAGVPLPVQQHRVRLGKRTYILDYAYPAALLALEFDGFETHGTLSAFHADRERSRALVAAGWALLQVTARTRTKDLVADVTAALTLSGQFATTVGARCPQRRY